MESSKVPEDQTLVIKGVRENKKGGIDESLSKDGLCGGKKDQPRFDKDKYGDHWVYYANYKSPKACEEAKKRMLVWLSKRNWDTSDLHVYVNQHGFACRHRCVCIKALNTPISSDRRSTSVRRKCRRFLSAVWGRKRRN